MAVETAEPRKRWKYTIKEREEILAAVDAVGVVEAARRHGVPQTTVSNWLHRDAARVAKERPKKEAAKRMVEEQRDQEILGEWHKHPGLGPSQIRNQLRRRGIRVAVATTRRVMEDAGYRPPKVKREPLDERFEAVRPNHLWHLDFVHRNINRATTYTLILIDDCARFVTGHEIRERVTDGCPRLDREARIAFEQLLRELRPFAWAP
jgi:transposase